MRILNTQEVRDVDHVQKVPCNTSGSLKGDRRAYLDQDILHKEYSDRANFKHSKSHLQGMVLSRLQQIWFPGC